MADFYASLTETFISGKALRADRATWGVIGVTKRTLDEPKVIKVA